MANRIQLRRDTASNWYNVNPLLSQGEPGLETDTQKIKYGNGSAYWRDLPYVTLASPFDQSLNTTDNPVFAGLAVAGNYLPSTLGSANQVIVTDGAGNLSWADQTGSGPGSTNTFEVIYANSATISQLQIFNSYGGAEGIQNINIVAPANVDFIHFQGSDVTFESNVSIGQGHLWVDSIGAQDFAGNITITTTATFNNPVIFTALNGGEGSTIQTSRVFSKQGIPDNGYGGYTFTNDAGADTGMFSISDGNIRFYNNNNNTVDSGSDYWQFFVPVKIGNISIQDNTLTNYNNGPIGLYTQGGAVNIDNWGYPSNSMRITNATDNESIMLQANGDSAQAKLRWHATANPDYRSVYSEVRTGSAGVEIHNADWSDTPSRDYKWTFATDGSLVRPSGIVENDFILVTTNTNHSIFFDQYSLTNFDSSQHVVKVRDGGNIHSAQVDVIHNGVDTWTVVSAVNTTGANNSGELGEFGAHCNTGGGVVNVFFTPYSTPIKLSLTSKNTQFPVVGDITPVIPITWTPITIGTDPVVQDVLDHRIFRSPVYDEGWNNFLYSAEGYATAYVEFKWIQGTLMMGLDNNPGSEFSWSTIQNKWFINGDTNSAYTWTEAGDPQFVATITTDSVFRLEFDGSTIKYILDGNLITTESPIAYGNHYLDSSFSTGQPAVQVLSFGSL